MRTLGLVLSAAVLLATAGLAASARAQDLSRVYPIETLVRDAPRLETAVRNIWTLGVEPVLTRQERAALRDVRFEFPQPRPGDYFLNFYAYPQDGRATVVMPVLSLKTLEDITTAYAWLYVNGRSLSTIDLYMTMLWVRGPTVFESGAFEPPLRALGIPENAHEQPGVDRLSLAFRNEAIAFILIHELGHVLFRHQPYEAISKAQARADEIESDRWALEVLERTGTAPLGAALFFQAQAYSLPHRGEFETEAAWQDYLEERATHPLTSDRLREMARSMADGLGPTRAAESDIWRFIGTQLEEITAILDDVELQRCTVTVANAARAEDLRPRDAVSALFDALCPD